MRDDVSASSRLIIGLYSAYAGAAPLYDSSLFFGACFFFRPSFVDHANYAPVEQAGLSMINFCNYEAESLKRVEVKIVISFLAGVF